MCRLLFRILMSKATNRNITKTNTNKIHARAFQYYKDTKTKKTKLQIYKWPIEASHPIKLCTKESTLLQGLGAPDFHLLAALSKPANARLLPIQQDLQLN